MNCHGHNCKNTKLVDAHIIPKGFGRLIRTGTGPLLKATGDAIKEAVPQLGEYDSNILCEACDNILGRNDEYAIKIAREFKSSAEDHQKGYFEREGIDCERLSKFVLSVIWRASISKRGVFSSVTTLGPYEQIAREIVFGSRPLSDLPAFDVIVSRFKDGGDDVTGVNIYPVKFRFQKLNAFSMVLSGFRIFAKLDRQPLSSEFERLIINRTNVFRGPYLEVQGMLGDYRLSRHLRSKQKASGERKNCIKSHRINGTDRSYSKQRC